RGEAPNIAAASRNRGSMLRSAGTTIRMTNGIAMTAWASGTTHHDVDRSSGALSKVSRNPNPTVTADVPSGSINTVSHDRVARPARTPIPNAASPPTTSATSVATAANNNELRKAAQGETNNVLVDALVPSARYDARLTCPPVSNEWYASKTRGAPRNNVVA